MSAKVYKITITKSNGENETIPFIIPSKKGAHKLKFTLSNGEEVDGGNIVVDWKAHSYSLKFMLSNGEEIDAGNIETPKATSFATMSWADISAIVESGLAPYSFSVGDEKTITLSTGEEITLVILGFNHDEVRATGSKRSMTIGMKNLLSATYYINADYTDTSGWIGSEMRDTTMKTLFSQLPADLQSVIKEVTKKSLIGGTIDINRAGDKLWLLSEVEINGTTEEGYDGEGEQYEYWKSVKNGAIPEDRMKYLSNGKGQPSGWWLRSASVGTDYAYRLVQLGGTINNTNMTIKEGICFCFCL